MSRALEGGGGKGKACGSILEQRKCRGVELAT